MKKPERVILVIIDGLHVEAPVKLNMSNFLGLAKQGFLIRNTTAIMPGHPVHGEYANIHTSSFPNPVMMTGTIFLKPGQKMLQQSFENAAFIANDLSYTSITDGYEFIIQKKRPDEFAIDKAIELLTHNNINFMRIHLQNTGDAGNRSYTVSENQPFKHNIWYEDSPYVHAVKNSDKLLNRLITELKKLGQWEETLLVITSDHGQTETGWHPLLAEESWLHPTLFHGPGIRQNETIEWADQIDIIPTIADIMQVPVPNEDGGSGKVLRNVQYSRKNSDIVSSSKLFEFNKILARYILAEAELLLNAVKYPFLNSYTMITERNFYGLERILEWDEMETIKSLTEHNRKIILEMEKKLNELK